MTTLAIRNGARRPAQFPPGVDGARRLMPLRHSGLLHRVKGAQLRRDACARDPLLFGILYFSELLRDEATGVMSFSVMHLAMAERGKRWATPGPDRSAFVGPRELGKSTWYAILVAWALAYGHRRFALFLSYTKDLAQVYVGKLRTALMSDSLLIHDFPHLSLRRGTGAQNSVGYMITAGSDVMPPVTIAARGMTDGILGLTGHKGSRPGIIIGDDLDPGPEQYTPELKVKSISRIENQVLPSNTRAAVMFTGATTAGAGCLMHDAVRASRGEKGLGADGGAWLRRATPSFDCYHFPAILPDGLGSLWRQRWPVAELEEMRAAGPRQFALNYLCDPDNEDANRWWIEGKHPVGTFRYDSKFQSTWRILSIDGAVTTKRTSNKTAVAQIAVSWDRKRVCVERAVQGLWSREELRAELRKLHNSAPRGTIQHWCVEVNQGGEMWREGLEPYAPTGVEVVPYTAEGLKAHRAETLLDEYQAGNVMHAGILTALEAQMTTWTPAAEEDDLIDAVGGGVRFALYGTPGKAPK